MENDSEKISGIKKYTRKIFDSPSSKARILTPVKNALHKSDGNTLKFLREVQNIVEKENVEKTYEEWEI